MFGAYLQHGCSYGNCSSDGYFKDSKRQILPAGTNFEMDAISACVVGGVSAYGGAGTVFEWHWCYAYRRNQPGMSLMGIDQNWQKL